MPDWDNIVSHLAHLLLLEGNFRVSGRRGMCVLKRRSWMLTFNPKVTVVDGAFRGWALDYRREAKNKQLQGATQEKEYRRREEATHRRQEEEE